MIAALAFAAVGLHAATVTLYPGAAGLSVADSAYVFVDEAESLTIDDVTGMGDRFRRNTRGFINPGTTSGIVWVRLDVRNGGAETSSWVLSLNRALLDPGEIYEVGSQGARTLLENSPQAFARSYARYATLAAPFELEPDLDTRLYVRYRGGNWSGLDLSLTTEAALRRKATADLLIFFLLLGGVGSLILYGSVSFVYLGQRIALLYALAELGLFGFYAHMGGFTTVYLWPQSPDAGRVVAPLTMVVFVVAMTEFARRFFDTAVTAPRLDKLLLTYVVLGCIAAIGIPLDYVLPAFNRLIPLYVLYAVSAATWLTLPPLAVYATFRWHRDYWPMALAWCLMGVFMLGLQLVWTGVVNVVPLGKNAYGVVAYAEALFLALAIMLRIRRLREERMLANRRLTESQQAELVSARRAMRMGAEREWAIRDLAEKGRLLLAAGHDTRQMVSALRHYSSGLERTTNPGSVESASRQIRQIADGLDEVLTTVIEASSSGGLGESVLALERVEPARILNPLRLIHGSPADEKGIDLRLRACAAPMVTDRVLVARILGNLVSNAIKYTDAGGTVLVACRSRAGGHRLQVFDTGSGMTAVDLARVLDSRTGTADFASTASGLGAGLPIARTLADRLGARLTGRSTPGAGTVFELAIPGLPQVNGARCSRVVLADTDTEQRLVVSEALESLALPVTMPDGPADVVTAVEGVEEPALVLLDVHFGGTEAGLDLCQRIRTQYSEAAVAILTYDRSIEARMRAAAVCSLIVYKPLSPALLSAALAHSITRRSRRSKK